MSWSAGVVEHADEIDAADRGQCHRLDAWTGCLPSTARCSDWPRTSCAGGPTSPAAVAIDEAVELAKELSTDESPAFVNGVLGRHRWQRDPA